MSDKRIVKVTLDEDQDAQIIFDEVRKQFGVDVDSQTLKFKRDGYSIKLVAGWPVSFYELKNQIVIDVESSDDNLDIQLEESSNTSTEKKMILLKKF